MTIILVTLLLVQFIIDGKRKQTAAIILLISPILTRSFLHHSIALCQVSFPIRSVLLFSLTCIVVKKAPEPPVR